ncbi:MAG: SDR family oxidoreductase [Nesterenkonia sp.]|uniref:SDR family oxidoreductase n=1 Tax=Nesterenkonia marinintestina TaxID=2979865 RepID=UPI0021BDFFE3|nr:SDR family oxidoreductase [Nesterenkonia sp. GX14115]MDO5493519.1 SDR family oxidoreductase [Nesterenkonia sp.]
MIGSLRRRGGPGRSISTAVITGAGSGIGRLLALTLAARGTRVALWDLDADSAEQVAEEIRGQGGEALALRCDVSDRTDVEAMAEETIRRLGPVDLLINNAGVVTGSRFEDTAPEQVERTFRVNSLAMFWTVRALLPGMRERDRGLIVNVASAAGIVGVARQTDYAASKFAAVGFSESLRAELRTEGSAVGVMVVCPYYISTGMFEGVTTRYPALLPITEPEDAVEKIMNGIDAGRARVVFPPAVLSTYAFRLFPVPWADRAMDLLGVNRGMDGFRGRSQVGSRHADPGRRL